jgi:hypothetical protein
MRTILRAATILAFCGAIAACSSTPPAPPPAPMAEAPAPATPPTTFDGVYRGMLTRVRTPTPRACARSHPITVRITNGAFSYAAGHKMTFTGPLAPDGSFTAMAGDTTLKGQAASTMLTGTLDGEKCGYTFSLKKRG